MSKVISHVGRKKTGGYSIPSNALDSLLLNVKGVAHSEINPFSFNSLLMYSSRSGMLYLILIKITLCDLHLRFFILSLFL